MVMQEQSLKHPAEFGMLSKHWKMESLRVKVRVGVQGSGSRPLGAHPTPLGSSQ